MEGISGARPALHRIIASHVALYALALAVVFASCAGIATALPPAGWPTEAARVAIAAIGGAGALALSAQLAACLRELLPARGRRTRLSASVLARGIAARSLLVAAGALAAAALCGIVAVAAQHLVAPAFGIGAAMAVARGFGCALVLAGSPLPAMLMLGYVRSRTGAWRPWREVCSAAGAYLPVLALTAAALLAGWGAHALCGLVPAYALGRAAFLALSAAIGCAWACAVCLVGLAPAPSARSAADGSAGRGETARLPRALRRRAGQGVAVAMAVLLAAGLVSPEAIAFAVEGDGPVIVAPAPEPVDAADAEPADAPEAQPTPPEGYYDAELPSGELVYAEGSMAVYQTAPNQFTTVIGGTEAAYVDERGNARAVDNTLVPVREGWLSDDVTYTNRAAGFDAKLPDEVSEARPIRLERDGHAIELVPEGGDFARSSAAGAAIRYTEVREGIDYQYTLVGSTVKEDIVLTRQVEPQALRTRLSLSEGLSAALEDGVVVIRRADGQPARERSADRGIFGDIGAEDEAEGDGAVAASEDQGGEGADADADADVAFAIAAPVMTDAAGAVSDDVELTLEAQADGSYVVGIEVGWDWACAPERAFPVRIDPTVNIAPSAVRVGCVEQTSPNSIIGENGYAYAGFDDGVKTGVGAYKPGGHYICRTYAAINYNFGYIMSEAKINSATFSLAQYRAYSGGATNFGLYRVTSGWNLDALTWNSQTGLGHEFVAYQRARTSPGYINWDVREVVNNWVQGVYPQRGFCVKAENERWMQCEMFENRYSANPPRLTISWEIPDPVDESLSLNGTTVNLRTVTEHDANNKLQLDGVFADGMARPRAWLAYELVDKADEAGLAYASRSYKYPDSSAWDEHVPGGTRYKDKLSNWQTHLFTNLEHDHEYKVEATPTLDGATGAKATSDRFLVYKASAKDTLPYIASHYGVTIDTLAADNRVQDSLVVGGNTMFVRNPTTTEAYNPTNLSTDQKKRIDSALMGRGKHCEYGFEPINLNTGNFVLEATDAELPEVEGALALSRTYNSKNEGANSPVGRN